MPGRDHEPLLRTSYFRVLIGERELGFAEISPLSSKTDAGIPGREHRHHFDTVILRRACGAVANSWRLVDAWPSRWSGPAFNALSGEVAIEELEVAFDDLVWLDQTTTQGG